jgi:hypothetical protein
LQNRYNRTLCQHCNPFLKTKSVLVSPIAVHGGWSEFGNWTKCSESCITNRTRECNNPVRYFGGSDCEGSKTEEIFCLNGDCPGDMFFFKWDVQHWAFGSGF